MARYCTINPQVKVNGELQDSKLFKDLKDYTFNNYNSSKSIYLATIHNVEKSFKSALNAQGEIDLTDLLTHYDVKKFLAEDFKDKLAANFALQTTNYSVENYANSLNQCNELNNSIYGINYFASIKIINNQIVPVIKPKSKQSSFKTQKEDIERSATLSKKLLQIMDRWGLKADVLYDAEERLSDGKVDVRSVEKAADGLYHIIRIAKGEKGLQALPEELGHVIVLALSESDLMQRTIRLVKDRGLAKEILGSKYEEEAELHNYDEDAIAEEAVGKLMAIHFLNSIGIKDDTIYSRILGRTVAQVEQFFSKFNETEISDAINEVNGNTILMTRDFMANNESLKISSNNLGKVFYQAASNEKRIDKLIGAVTKILETERRRQTIFRSNKHITKETSDLLKDLKARIKQEDYADAILQYLKHASQSIQEIVNELDELNKRPNMDLSSKARRLRHFRNVIFSYLKITQQLSNDLSEEFTFGDSMLDSTVKDLLTSNAQMLGQCMTEYNRHAKNVIRQYFAPILGEHLTVDNGWFNKNETKYTVDQILRMDVNDISWFDMMLDSASDSRSFLVRGVDKAIKDKQGKAQQLAIEFYKKISARTNELREKGYKDTKWCFEKDENGHKTGYYLTRYNHGKRDKEREAYRKEMIEKYHMEGKALYKEMEDWDNAHPISNYPNTAWDRLTEVQKDYLRDIINYKNELDILLPITTNPIQTVKIRKDLMERVLSAHSPKDALHAFTESIKEGFVRNSVETEYGIKSVLTDFEGMEYRELPVFYVHKGKDVSEDDISEDVVSTMTAYASMAYENYEMSDIIDILETTRGMLRDSENPYETVGGKRAAQLFAENTEAFKRSDKNRTLERLNSLFDMQIYKKTKKDEGTLGPTKIDKGKAADRLMGWSTLTTMAFNTLANISNVMTGNIQFKLEAVAGQFFNYKDAAVADGLFNKHLAGFMMDFANKTKSSYLYTVGEAFGVMQETERDLKDMRYDLDWYKRMSIGGVSMFLQHMGEFWMHHRTFFALMNSDKEMLLDSTGKQIKALNAFEVKPVDSKHPNSGSELIFKKGLVVQHGSYKGKTIVTKEELQKRAEGTGLLPTNEKLLKDNEISQYTYVDYMKRKTAKLNQQMHGIYNEQDKAAVYANALGRMVGQYRKWIKPSLNRRFSATKFDYDLDTVNEGYYRTLTKMIGQIYRDIKAQEFKILGNRFKDIFTYDENKLRVLENYEAANMRKVLAEWLAFTVILMCIAAIPDDDDTPEKDKSYFYRMYKYQLYRLKNEIGVLIPGPYMVKEGVKIVQSPMASVSLLDRISNTFTLFTPWNWKEIQSGRYKGWYRPFNTIMDLVPYNRSIYRTFHPEEGTAFYM